RAGWRGCPWHPWCGRRGQFCNRTGCPLVQVTIAIRCRRGWQEMQGTTGGVPAGPDRRCGTSGVEGHQRRGRRPLGGTDMITFGLAEVDCPDDVVDRMLWVDAQHILRRHVANNY